MDVRIGFAGDWHGNVAGLSEEISVLLGTRVDVVASDLLRDKVAATALADAVPL